MLGEVTVHAADRLVDIGYTQLQAVLAVLVFEANQTVPVDHLVDRVWGTRQLPRRPRAAVQHSVTLVRKALAANSDVTIAWRSAGYRLAVDPAAVDLHRFRQLVGDARGSTDDDTAATLFEQALQLWRGVPFSGLETPWFADLRVSLGVEWRAARLDLTDIQLRRGQHATLLAELAEQTGQHPLDERLAGQYLLALYRSGRQAQALEHYHRLRHLLAEELGTDPGSPLRQLHQQIVTADPALAAPTPVVASAPQSRPVPRQLPAPPRVFAGRTTELAYLDTALNQHADMVISTLTGAGGIGKTSLALHWAHQHVHRFPDGQLFVDLHGFSPVDLPLAPAVAIRGFLDALGVDPASIPPDPQAQVGLYRSLVADKRILIVLDNAADAAQIDSLLPGSPSCAVTVTSRRHLTGLAVRHGAHQLKLDALTDAEARQLLTNRLGADRLRAEPAAVDELLAHCAGFPLALAIVAARIHAAADQPLAVLAAELRDTARLDAFEDENDPAASLRAALSWSLRALTDEQVHMFGLLGIAPGPDIALPAAISLLGLSPKQAERALRGLHQASLIDHGPNGRYSMHDLIRAYATATASRELTENARDEALRRVMDFYTHTAHTAARLLDPHLAPLRLDPPAPGAHPHPLADLPTAKAWFDSEYANLLAAQHTATSHAWHDCVWDLAWTLTTFQYRRGHRHDWLAVWRAALAAAEHLSDPTPSIRAHRFVGRAYAELGRHEEAFGHLHRALTLAEHHHQPTDQAHTHRQLSVAWERRGDDRRALDHSTRALALFRGLDLPVWEAVALNDVGWDAARLGDYDTARVHCQAALTLRHDHHDTEGEAETLDTLGYIDHHTGDHGQAIRHYQRALTLYRSLGDTYEAAAILDNLGHPHVALGQHEQAGVAWREALELYRQTGRYAEAERVRRQLDVLDRHPDAR